MLLKKEQINAWLTSLVILTDPRQQELEVQEALHNEARARFIATELRF